MDMPIYGYAYIWICLYMDMYISSHTPYWIVVAEVHFVIRFCLQILEEARFTSSS